MCTEHDDEGKHTGVWTSHMYAVACFQRCNEYMI
jgi:hypothetical protein